MLVLTQRPGKVGGSVIVIPAALALLRASSLLDLLLLLGVQRTVAAAVGGGVVQVGEVVVVIVVVGGGGDVLHGRLLLLLRKRVARHVRASLLRQIGPGRARAGSLRDGRVAQGGRSLRLNTGLVVVQVHGRRLRPALFAVQALPLRLRHGTVPRARPGLERTRGARGGGCERASGALPVPQPVAAAWAEDARARRSGVKSRLGRYAGLSPLLLLLRLRGPRHWRSMPPERFGCRLGSSR
mmetsp:Transcript_1036/g.2767  ORF Transcript_1036/g.2767 Transcript_1036/m.2767 type:complete len:240 (-) Transcript_1036:300-1019(-)